MSQYDRTFQLRSLGDRFFIKPQLERRSLFYKTRIWNGDRSSFWVIPNRTSFYHIIQPLGF